MGKIAILAAGGIGDQTLAFSCAEILRQRNIDFTIFCLARNEVFEVIDHLFKTYNPVQLPEYKEDVIKLLDSGEDKELRDIQGLYDKVYCVWPDLLFNSKHSFPYQNYNVSLETLTQTKLLLNSWAPEDIIYIALNSSTPEYQVAEPERIVKEIALNNPNHLVYFPIVENWANIKLDYFNEELLNALPNNVIIHKNPDFLASLEILKKSSFMVAVDNGISHISKHLGIPRLLLDARISAPGFVARWRYGMADSIPQDTQPESIGRVIKTCLNIPQSQLLPRRYVLDLEQNYNLTKEDWARILILKE